MQTTIPSKHTKPSCIRPQSYSVRPELVEGQNGHARLSQLGFVGLPNTPQPKLRFRLPLWAIQGLWLMCLALLIGPLHAQNRTSQQDALDAARLGHTRALETALKAGLSTETADEQGNTLLILAAREGFEPTTSLLLNRGAAVGARNHHGETALMLAVLKDHKPVVDALLRAGSPLDHPEPTGWTALHYAAFEGHAHWVEVLILAGANVNALTPNQANPLMLAARNGHMAIVRRLLQTPVRLEQQTDQGLTAQAWARQTGNTDIADLIDRAQNVRRAR